MEGAGGRVFLLSPALLGLGSGRLLGGWLSSGLGLLAFALALAWLASGLGASAAVVEVAAVASLARLAALAALTSLVLLVLLAVPHRSGTGWTSGGGMTVGKAGGGLLITASVPFLLHVKLFRLTQRDYKRGCVVEGGYRETCVAV